MPSTLAELKTRILKVILWITLCKTFYEWSRKSLIDGKWVLFCIKGFKERYKNSLYKSCI